MTPAPAPPPDADAPETTDTAVPTDIDQDADNYADALEPEAGLDPTTADTDADYVADGDEFNLYQTDPTVADTDGDEALDGENSSAATPIPCSGMTATTGRGPPPVSWSRTGPGIRPVETSTTAESMEPVATDATSDKEAAYAAGDTASPPGGRPRTSARPVMAHLSLIWGCLGRGQSQEMGLSPRTARAGWHRERQRPDEPLVTFRLTDDAAIRPPTARGAGSAAAC